MIEPTHRQKDGSAQLSCPASWWSCWLGRGDRVNALCTNWRFALAAVVHDYGMSREFMNVLAPSLLSGDGALDKSHLSRLVGYGLALVERTSCSPQVFTVWVQIWGPNGVRQGKKPMMSGEAHTPNGS